jgi:hypothetical protein
MDVRITAVSEPLRERERDEKSRIEDTQVDREDAGALKARVSPREEGIPSRFGRLFTTQIW